MELPNPRRALPGRARGRGRGTGRVKQGSTTVTEKLAQLIAICPPSSPLSPKVRKFLSSSSSSSIAAVNVNSTSAAPVPLRPGPLLARQGVGLRLLVQLPFAPPTHAGFSAPRPPPGAAAQRRSSARKVYYPVQERGRDGDEREPTVTLMAAAA